MTAATVTTASTPAFLSFSNTPSRPRPLLALGLPLFCRVSLLLRYCPLRCFFSSLSKIARFSSTAVCTKADGGADGDRFDGAGGGGRGLLSVHAVLVREEDGPDHIRRGMVDWCGCRRDESAAAVVVWIGVVVVLVVHGGDGRGSGAAATAAASSAVFSWWRCWLRCVLSSSTDAVGVCLLLTPWLTTPAPTRSCREGRRTGGCAPRRLTLP